MPQQLGPDEVFKPFRIHVYNYHGTRVMVVDEMWSRGRGKNPEGDIEHEGRAVNITFIHHLVGIVVGV